MIGYTCKYTPIELLYALGADLKMLDDEEENFELAESLTHANLCSHAKALIQQGKKMDELILMDCCDSLRRTFDVLSENSDYDFLELMDLPHETGICAKERFSEQLKKIARKYAKLHGTSFSKEKFLEKLRESSNPLPAHDYFAVLGARVSPQLLELIENELDLPVVNLTCSGNRNLEEVPEDAENMSEDELIEWYAGALLDMIPCMRMASVSERKRLTNDPHLRGIVYNTVKFCDFYSFDYYDLKSHSDIPILKIESDYMPQPSGQLSTRLEAFSESLLGHKNKKGKVKLSKNGTGLYAGIDSGSTTTNMVVIDDDEKILASSIVRTGAKAQNGAKAALENICSQLNVDVKDLDVILATGYGRNNIPFATDTKTEITCHARGAHHINPDIRTIVDIGGQDSKVICLDETGNVVNFIMNDKCAAGTGRFLEMMARTLEIDLGEMSKRGLSWKKDLTISSMCTVFAESEVISLIADNNSDNDIIHGLNKSIASKTASMVKRAKGHGNYMMTGGVARNSGVINELENKLGESLYISKSPAPDLCGALGAALFARDAKSA